MSESAISELKTRIRSRIIRSDTVDRENLERMGVLMHEMNTLLSKPNNKILEDVVWKSQVMEFVKFLEYSRDPRIGPDSHKSSLPQRQGD